MTEALFGRRKRARLDPRRSPDDANQGLPLVIVVDRYDHPLFIAITREWSSRGHAGRCDCLVG